MRRDESTMTAITRVLNVLSVHLVISHELVRMETSSVLVPYIRFKVRIKRHHGLRTWTSIETVTTTVTHLVFILKQ